jgi:hypothetical protein
VNPTATKLAGAAAAVLAFFAAKYAVVEFREKRSAAAVEQQMEQMQADAVAKRPDQPKSMAFAEEAKERTAEKLAAAPTVTKRENDAADMFWGFYLGNTRLRPAYCKEQGVDITAFVTAFAKAHETEFAKAKAVYRRAGANENEVFGQVESMVRGMIVQDVKDMAAAFETTEAGACQIIADNADALVAEMLLSKVNPPVYEALKGASL